MGTRRRSPPRRSRVPPPASLSDTAVDIPVDRTRALYVFNARVANKAEGITSAKFELIVSEQYKCFLHRGVNGF